MVLKLELPANSSRGRNLRRRCWCLADALSGAVKEEVRAGLSWMLAEGKPSPAPLTACHCALGSGQGFGSSRRRYWQCLVVWSGHRLTLAAPNFLPALGTGDSERSAVTGRGSPRLESQGMSRERCPRHPGDVHGPGTALGAGAAASGWSQPGRAVISIPFKHRCSAL